MALLPVWSARVWVTVGPPLLASVAEMAEIGPRSPGAAPQPLRPASQRLRTPVGGVPSLLSQVLVMTIELAMKPEPAEYRPPPPARVAVLFLKVSRRNENACFVETPKNTPPEGALLFTTVLSVSSK